MRESGVVWCGVVRCGVLWFLVVCCSAVWFRLHGPGCHHAPAANAVPKRVEENNPLHICRTSSCVCWMDIWAWIVSSASGRTAAEEPGKVAGEDFTPGERGAAAEEGRSVRGAGCKISSDTGSVPGIPPVTSAALRQRRRQKM